ncbi:phosphate signaling complex protein PhoU [Mangrovimicrobium sediminis]|uniref:Phosphate-specific transport system accessory protein PhoU n=1 Tax=Mangrovimicrobium sediminis TaxID=2562682 RepID=A0A4Z0M7I2_9GAMM|nr:phosphate signaling complex protein PhoU [Haliea sp. SAOS-164]
MNLDQHTSHRFNEELEDVRARLLEMGGLVEEQCRKALKALTKGNLELAIEVANSDYRINEMEVEINARCMDILALRQPAATDLRVVVAIIRMTADLERIGDEAEKIGRFAQTLAERRDAGAFRGDPKHLGKLAIAVLRGALDAFARLDVSAAIETAAQDPEIDQEFESVTRLLISHMMEQPAAVKSLLRVNWCARALERIGDHAVNLCEEVIFLVKGSDVRHLSLKEVQDRFL